MSGTAREAKCDLRQKHFTFVYALSQFGFAVVQGLEVTYVSKARVSKVSLKEGSSSEKVGKEQRREHGALKVKPSNLDPHVTKSMESTNETGRNIPFRCKCTSFSPPCTSLLLIPGLGGAGGRLWVD